MFAFIIIYMYQHLHNKTSRLYIHLSTFLHIIMYIYTVCVDFVNASLC